VSAQWQALASGELPVYDVEQQFLRRDGRWVWGRMAATVLRDGTGGSQFILLQVQDITDRKQAQQELQERQTHLRALLDAVPDLMFRIQSDGVILDYHAHDPSLLYRPAGELIGARYTELLPPEAVRNIGEALKKAVATGRLQRAEYSLPVPAGMRDFEARFMRSGAQEAIVIVRDITERRRLDRQLLEVGEHERRRIGQDLHDGVCQQLVGIGFMVRLLEQQLQAAQSPAAAAVHGIAGHLHDAIRDAREVSHGLHPVRLDEEGLALALRELAAQVSRTGEVSCEFEYPEPVPVADNNAATHLYRIAQEAVNNALKHGKPRHITIALTGENETTELRIEDDGVGFGAAPDPTAKGIGLQVMEYRARLIGGILNLGPRPKGGTVVTCSWGGR
jgi:two-component system CheB/CheR fusion protein